MKVTWSRNADLHLADALSAQIERTSTDELLAEAAEDFGDADVLVMEFDAAFANAIAQNRRQRLRRWMTDLAGNVFAATRMKVAAGAATAIIISTAALLHVQDRWGVATDPPKHAESSKEDASSGRRSVVRSAPIRTEADEELKALHERFEALRQAGNWAEAKVTAERQLVLAKATYGNQHTRYAGGLSDLADAYLGLGNYAMAEAYLKEGLAITERVLGTNPDVASFLQKLGGIYRVQNREPEALAALKRSLEVAEKSLGHQHPDVVRQRRELAELERITNVATAGAGGPEVVVVLRDGAPIRCCTFSRDGTRLATISGNTVRITRIDQPGASEEIKTAEPPIAVVFSPELRIFTLVHNNSIKMWTAQGKLLKSFGPYSSKVMSVLATPAGPTVLVAGDDTVRIMEGARVLAVLTGHHGPVDVAAFSADGKLVVTAADTTVRVWSRESGMVLSVMRVLKPVDYATFSLDGRKLAFIRRDDPSIEVWDVRMASPLLQIRDRHAPARIVEFSPDGRKLLVAYDGGSMALKDLRTGQGAPSPMFLKEQGTGAAFSPDGNLIAVVSRDMTVDFWKVVP